MPQHCKVWGQNCPQVPPQIQKPTMRHLNFLVLFLGGQHCWFQEYHHCQVSHRLSQPQPDSECSCLCSLHSHWHHTPRQLCHFPWTCCGWHEDHVSDSLSYHNPTETCHDSPYTISRQCGMRNITNLTLACRFSVINCSTINFYITWCSQTLCLPAPCPGMAPNAHKYSVPILVGHKLPLWRQNVKMAPCPLCLSMQVSFPLWLWAAPKQTFGKFHYRDDDCYKKTTHMKTTWIWPWTSWLA